jgi:hypothetical protein
MAHADRLDLLDRSRVSVSARDGVSTAARAALTIYASPPSFPVGGLPTGEVPLRMAAVKAAQAQSTSAARENARREAMREAYAASWKEAFSPLRNLLTTGLMLWMAGNSVQVFSVMSAVTALTMQLQGLFAVRRRFGAIVKANADLQGRLVPQAIVYVLLYGVGVGLALHKCNVLGFLPTEESDWIGLLPSEHVEPSVLGGVTF